MLLWLLWIALTVPAGLYVAAVIAYGGHRGFLLIGRASDGHHQIELACDACHTSLFGGREALQAACVDCHGAELKAANDTHPQSKFTDPRNVERTARLDARYCVTCHQEHRPNITRAMGVTLPDDLCFLCHQDVGKERPSHLGLAFTTCASAGCHNFHDNRALYTDFLRRNGKQPDHLKAQRIALVDARAAQRAKDRAGRTPLAAADQDAPPQMAADAGIVAAWAGDAHAAAGINCTGCHVAKDSPGSWVAAPGFGVCRTCHSDQGRSFTEGKHGMRLRDGLGASREGPFGLFAAKGLEPMTPGEARLPMKHAAVATPLGCTTCHGPHRYDLAAARVTACVACHDDDHTKAYFGSPHHALLQKEASAALPPGSGVSCATCHLPLHEQRRDGARLVAAMHNQNDNLRPNEKMARSVCLHCHGLRLTLDALADAALVRRNFQGVPAAHVESIDWANRRTKRAATP